MRTTEVRVYPGPVRLLSRAGACVAILALDSCAQGPAPPAAKLWTLFDVDALYAAGAPSTKALAVDDGFPGGVPLGGIVDPPVPPAGPMLVPHTGTADGYLVNYVTTEVWSDYAQVWMQPVYVPITGVVNGVPHKVVDEMGAWHPIFSVGPASGFYSPYWQITYVTVPAGTTSSTFTSAKQILDSGYPLLPTEGQTMPLVPDQTSGGGLAKAGSGWLDGAAISFLDFGSATFTWDAATNVIAEKPIYYFTVTGTDGAPHVLPHMPSVLGTVPPGATPPAATSVGGIARYSAYWRMYTVALPPPPARIFAPPGSAAEADLLALNLSAGAYTDALVADPADYTPFIGRVAANPGDPSTGTPGCFDDPGAIDVACVWLDSQAALEANVDPSTIQATGISVTCPVTTVKTIQVNPL